MTAKYCIIVCKQGEEPEPFGNFKKMCDIVGLPYHTLKRLKFPITYNEYTIYKKKVY